MRKTSYANAFSAVRQAFAQPQEGEAEFPN